MYLQVIKLLDNHNSKLQGLYIPQGIIPFVMKLNKYANFIYQLNGSELQGFIAYYHNDPEGELAYLPMILVDQHHQSKGIGNKIMNECMTILDSEGFRRTQLEVLKENNRAIYLYKKFGFTIIQEGSNLYLMERCKN